MKVPSPRKPLAGYLRLTVDRQGNKIGYDVQQRGITAMAAISGDTIGAWYKDKDLTAADLSVERPEYERMLKEVASGRWGGVVVWRLDRLVRLTREFERVWGIVQDSGGFIASAEPMISTRDDIGLMFMRLLVMFAEMEISGMKVRAKAHQQAKRESGRYSGGGSRAFGFVGAEKDEAGRVLNPGEVGIAHVPAEAELLQDAARRIAWDGESYSDVLHEWAARDVRGTRGSHFTTTTLFNTLTSPRIAGLRDYMVVDEDTGESRTVYVQAEWAQILDRATWDRLRSLKKAHAKPGRAYEYLLTGGLAVCGRCEQKLAGARFKSGSRTGVPGYRCDTSPRAKAQGACGRLTVTADPVEKLVVVGILRRVAASPEILATLSARDDRARGSELEDALTVIAEADSRLAGLAAMYGRQQLSDKEWTAAREPLLTARARASATVDEVREQSQTVPTPPSTDREVLLAWYEALTLTQRRAFVRAFVKSVKVLPAARTGGSEALRRFDPGRVVVVPSDPK